MSSGIDCIFTVRVDRYSVTTAKLVLAGNFTVKDMKADDRLIPLVLDTLTKMIFEDMPEELEPQRDRIDLVLFFPDLLN